MLIDNGDGTTTGGPLDALIILHNVNTNRYHAAFFEEMAPPGPVKEVFEVAIVRLKSRMHHTAGADTIDEAKHHLAELASKIQLPPENIFEAPEPWDGRHGVVLLRENWRRA